MYLATAPKSNRVYVAWGKALELAERTGVVPVPMHLRNAPTKVMKELWYGAGSALPHDSPAGEQWQDALPRAVRGPSLYEAGEFDNE